MTEMTRTEVSFADDAFGAREESCSMGHLATRIENIDKKFIETATREDSSLPHSMEKGRDDRKDDLLLISQSFIYGRYVHASSASNSVSNLQVVYPEE
jgi:hypothetical protein